MLAAPDTKTEEQSIGPRPARLVALARLDRRLAWIVSCAPPVGFILAIALAFLGSPVRPYMVWIWLVMHIAVLIGVEVGFHRHFTHRSFKMHPALRVILAILGSMAFQGPVIWWSATHRRHHRFSDRPGDPHSPNLVASGFRGFLKGQFHAHIGWLFLPESTRAQGWDRYARDLYRDKAIFRVHALYFYWLGLGFLIPSILGWAATRTLKGAFFGFLWGGPVRIFLMNHVFYWCINSVTHTFGSRPFESHDMSTNNIWLAIPTLGQSWHNNHHAFPASAIMGMKWWEVDVGGWVIRVFEKLGLAWDVNTPSPRLIESKRPPARKDVTL
jgi:stearoyl-CoA desaturase (delta-9 desaturase)